MTFCGRSKAPFTVTARRSVVASRSVSLVRPGARTDQPQHGFARIRNWTYLGSQGAADHTALTFQLTATPETREAFAGTSWPSLI